MLARFAVLAGLLLTAACAGQPFVYNPFAHQGIECPVAGEYAVAGTAPDGSEYRGGALIVGTSEGCFVRWTGTNETYGPGKFMVGMLKVEFTRAGKRAEATYKRTMHDGLRGEWHYVDDAERKGLETLTWVKPPKPAKTASR
jgi:hypothetical protein